MSQKMQLMLRIVGLSILSAVLTVVAVTLAWMTVAGLSARLQTVDREDLGLTRLVSEATRQQLDQTLRFSETLLFSRIGEREKFELANESFVFAGKRFTDILIEAKNTVQQGIDQPADEKRRAALDALKGALSDTEKAHANYEHLGASLIRETYQYTFITTREAGSDEAAATQHKAFLQGALSRLEDDTQRLEGKLKEVFNLTNDLSRGLAAGVAERERRVGMILVGVAVLAVAGGISLAFAVAISLWRARNEADNRLRASVAHILEGVREIIGTGGRLFSGTGEVTDHLRAGEPPLRETDKGLREMERLGAGQAHLAREVHSYQERGRRESERVELLINGFHRLIREAVVTGDRARLMVDQMGDAALQVNLLATNATAEASRSEATREFIVFTDEIKTVSQRVAELSREVSALVDGVSKGTRLSFDQAREAAQRVAEILDLAERGRLQSEAAVQGATEQLAVLEKVGDTFAVLNERVRRGLEEAAAAHGAGGALQERGEGVIELLDQLRVVAGDRRKG